MLKARIITASLENAEPLAEQLRKRGCKVEIVRPAEATAGPVDFEFELESCPADRALDRAAELSKQRSADIYVAAGCFAEQSARPATDPRSAIAPSIVDERVFSETRQRQRDSMARDLREKRVLMQQARAAQRKADQSELHPPTLEPIPAPIDQQLESQEESIHGAQTLDPSLARQWAQSVPTPSISPRSRELRVAFGVAAMVAALFMLGWSAVSRNTYPSTPSPSTGVAQAVEHQLPANSAIIQAPKLVQSSVSEVAKPVANRTQPARLAIPSTHRLPNRVSRKHVDDELVAEDKVRYFTRRAKPSKQPSGNSQHASLKHYSDIE